MFTPPDRSDFQSTHDTSSYTGFQGVFTLPFEGAWASWRSPAHTMQNPPDSALCDLGRPGGDLGSPAHRKQDRFCEFRSYVEWDATPPLNCMHQRLWCQCVLRRSSRVTDTITRPALSRAPFPLLSCWPRVGPMTLI